MRIAVLCNDRLAVPALQLLIQNKLVLAVGIPDRASEATQFITHMCRQAAVPVQIFAAKNLESSLMTWMQLHQPDIVLVKTFPWKIPSALLSVPKSGFVNFHYAPLPEFRGPAPLFHMIKNRVPEIGVSVHKMNEEFDAGGILAQKRVPLPSEATYGMCTGQLAFIGAELTGTLLQGMVQGTLAPAQQDSAKAKWYARPLGDDLRIDWKKMSAQEIAALVRASNPWAKGAVTSWNNWTIGITEVSPFEMEGQNRFPAGTLAILNDKQGLIVACADAKFLRIDIVYTEEGFFPGHKLLVFGLTQGSTFG